MIDEIIRFQSVINFGSVTKASKKIKITQPALSQSIKRLEFELGYKLFNQKQRHLYLTDKGEKFYRLSQKIIDLWKRSIEIDKNQNKNLSIGLFDNASLRLARFISNKTKNKDYSIEVKIDKSKILLQDLGLGLVDLAVAVINPNSEILKGIILKSLLKEELIPVSSKKFNMPADSVPFILYNNLSTTRANIDQVFIKNEINPNITAQSTSPSFMKELALSGAGVALLPDNLIDEELKKRKLFKQNLPFKFSRSIGVFVRQDNANDPDIQKLSEDISENLIN